MISKAQCKLKGELQVKGSTVAKIDPEANEFPEQSTKLLFPAIAIKKTYQFVSKRNATEDNVEERKDGLKLGINNEEAIQVGTELVELKQDLTGTVPHRVYQLLRLGV